MARIFVSYRRADSASIAGRIYDFLAARYRRKNVFKDVDSIPAGQDFRAYIQQVLRECLMQVVVIGPGWLDARSSDDQRRLDQPDDLVRVEIETAHDLGLVIIPVLVGDTTMPASEALPSSLQFITRLNAVIVRNDPDFKGNVKFLASTIDREITSRAKFPASFRWYLLTHRFQVASIAALVLVCLVLSAVAVDSLNAIQLQRGQVALQSTQIAAQSTAARAAAATATVSAFHAQATQVANAAAAQATQTTIAQILAPYHETAIGPCGPNPTRWSLTPYMAKSDPFAPACSSTATHVTVDQNTHRTVSLTYKGPGPTFPSAYTASVTFDHVNGPLMVSLDSAGSVDFNLQVLTFVGFVNQGNNAIVYTNEQQNGQPMQNNAHNVPFSSQYQLRVECSRGGSQTLAGRINLLA